MAETTPPCTVRYADHVGIAVRDLEAAMALFHDVFGVPRGEVTVLEDQGVKATLLPLGQTRLELLEPLSPESPVGRFIQRRGEGLHHLALNVDDIDGKLRALADRGVELVDSSPREGLSGAIAFLHPRSTHGVLTELVETAGPQADSDADSDGRGGH
ncbi:MAG: methylmalonyl-CoA epimerase [Dehalococcoidia bacterium]|nr:methylmalonyl-CoA epimerase [Dehalococcoidia bacterium]